MGEVQTSCCGDPELGGEPMCPPSPAREAGRGCVLLDGTDFESQPASEKIGVSASGSGEQPCSPLRDDNGASVEGQIESLVSEQGLVGEALTTVADEENYGFPGLSPLRTFGVGGGYEAVLFSDDRDESALFVSSGSDADCLLMDMRGNTANQADELCCPPLLGECVAAPAGSEANRIKERVGDQLFGLQTVQGPPLDHVGKWQEQSESDACVASEGIGTCPLEIVEGEKQPSLQLETEAVRSVHSSPDKVVPSSAIEESNSLHSSHVMTAMNYSSKLSSGVGNRTSTCCKPSPVIVFRRSNPKRAASLRNTPADRNPDQLARTIHGAKKRPKAVDTKTLILSRISNSLTRKRRFSCRPALRSVWGAVENLIKTFEQNDKLANCDRGAIGVQNKKTKKERSGLGKKRPKAQKGGNLRVSNGRSTTPSKSAHIKDQKPQNSLLHDGVDSQASVYPGVNGCLLKYDGKICVGFAKNGDEVEHKSLEQTRHARVKLLEHRMYRDKDLESTLTQDTSAENMPGEYPLISSRSGTESLAETVDEKCLIDPGTSPDSDVYHPAMDVPIASACTTPTNQVAGMDPSALATETISHYSPNADFSTYSEAFVTHASVSPLDTQPLTNHKKGKKGKKNCIARGSLLSSSEHCFGERELNSPENLSKARKASKYSIPEWKEQEGCNERSPICAKSFRKATRKGPICNSFQVKSSLLGMAEFERCEDSMKLAFDLDNRVSSEWDDVNAQSEEGTLGGSLLTDKAKGIKLSRDTKARLSKGRSSHPDSVRHRRRNGHGKRKENVRKSCSKGGSKEKSGANHACIESGGGLSLALGVSSKLALTGPTTLSSKINAGSKVVAVDIPSSVMLPICDEPASKEYCLGLEGQSLRPRAAWVLCDDCQKWRCIPAALADIIDETNCKWTCKDNKDKAFADCSIPQEKTNAEINAELEISDASGDEKSSRLQLNFKAIEPSKPSASQPASWSLIKSNIFLHRNRKSQTIDEIMVCHCKPSSDGSLGCGEECLNRMLNIECVRGTCPCGYLCSNQQFQKRKYSKFKWFRCGKKGFGLQLQEDVSPGQFLIEYVGEVLDFAAYEARQREYASRGQKHFYFMTLNGGEVIDACIKGNLGRFINHSCVPNCRTEKWMVNGEVCIGLFAIRDIKKGEEVTFDYNYERVFGAAAKKCVCGSAECRGYIGGDPLNTEAIVQGDSDEEYPEPVMVCGDGERGLDRHVTVSDSIDAKVTNHKEIPIQMGDDDVTVSDAIDPTVVKHEEISIRTEDLSSKYPLTIPELEICPQREDTSSRPLSDDHLENLDPIQTEDTMDRPLSDTEVLDNSSHSSNSIQTEEIMCKPVSDVQPLEVSLGNSIAVNEYISDSVLHNKKLILSNVDDKPNISKPYPHTKSSRLKGTIKKARSRAKSLAPHKVKKVPTDTSSGHFEGVEEKLNELLDDDGGISKRKDATKGYLKLLFVTAAEGDNIRGFACQSTRDLSLILDALLKTKSRMVLMDIINKNGLQMLHNIMKQNRSNFNRIPIIRKLLKVLEFLALKGILTLEHINRSPPCSGMESFKESILILTRHQDTQVNQIARNFRDKWIPRTSRRVEPSFKCWHDQGTRETDAIVRISEAVSILRSSCESDIARETSTLPCQQFYVSASLADYNPTSEGKTRKRKSRWDHPSDASSDPQSLWSMKDQTVEAGSKLMKFTCSQLEQTSQQELVWQKSEMHKEETSSCDEIPSLNNSMQQNVDDEAPPGFESPQKNNHAQIPCRSLVVAGDVVMMDHPQKDDEAPPGFGSPREDHHPQIPSKTSVVAGDVVMAHLQERYLPHLTVSYGMPVALMQQLGASEAEGGNQCHPRWAVAPGMPFHPFPPLPLYTRGEPNPTAPGPTSSGHNVMTQRTKEETQLAKQCHAPPHLDFTDPRTSGERSAHMEAGARNPRIKERVKWPSHGCGRRFFRPQRWHNPRFDRCWPPWPREGNGFRGSPNHGASNNCIENTRRDNSEAYYFPEGVCSSDVRSNFHQPPRHD